MTPVHSQADPHAGDGRLSAPSAARNAPAIVAALADVLPATGRVLEIAAGTGEHAVALARAYPGLDLAAHRHRPRAPRLASTPGRAAEGARQHAPATPLDAAAPGLAGGAGRGRLPVEPAPPPAGAGCRQRDRRRRARPRSGRALLPLRPVSRARRLSLRGRRAFDALARRRPGDRLQGSSNGSPNGLRRRRRSRPPRPDRDAGQQPHPGLREPLIRRDPGPAQIRPGALGVKSSGGPQGAAPRPIRRLHRRGGLSAGESPAIG